MSNNIGCSCSRGFDTTSAIFGLGKGTIFSNINTNVVLHDHCNTLQSASSSAKDVCSAGVSLILSLYGGKDNDFLADMHYEAYSRFASERLPPSEGAAWMYIMCVHYKAVIWGALGRFTIKPTDWGWKVDQSHLKPIHVDGPIAPDDLLDGMRFNCHGDNASMCSCCKNGLHCVSACLHCCENACTNSRDETDSADSEIQ